MPRRPDDEDNNEQTERDEELEEDIDELMDLYGYDDVDDFLADYPDAYELMSEDYLDELDIIDELDSDSDTYEEA